MKKSNVIAGILAMLCVMSISGCGDKETESSAADATTVATTEATTQATTVTTTTEATTTTKESGSLELGMPFSLGNMSVDMPSNLLYYSEDYSSSVDGQLHYWKSTEWIVQASYTKIKGTDSEVDFLVNLAAVFDHDENDIDFCSIADSSSMIVTRKETGDGISQIAYYIANNGVYYSLVFCSKADTDIKSDVEPIIDSIKFSGESSITQTTSENGNGKMQKTDNFNITLLGAKELELEDWMKNGQNKENIILAVYFEFENTSDEICDVGMYNFKAYVDDYSAQEHYVMRNDPDGYSHIYDDIAPGKKAKGYRAFEIPSDWNKFEVTYEDGSETATFVIDKSLTVN